MRKLRDQLPGAELVFEVWLANRYFSASSSPTVTGPSGGFGGLLPNNDAPTVDSRWLVTLLALGTLFIAMHPHIFVL